jgi:hypothetical protein
MQMSREERVLRESSQRMTNIGTQMHLPKKLIVRRNMLCLSTCAEPCRAVPLTTSLSLSLARRPCAGSRE